MSDVIQLRSFRRQFHLQASPVFGMSSPPDKPLCFELIDHTRHGAELDLKTGSKLAHLLRTMKVEHPQTVGLRNGENAIRRLVGASELIKRRKLVQTFVKTKQVIIGSHLTE